MKKEWKIFPSDSCPNCGGQLEVLSELSEEKDTETEIFVLDADDIRCVARCGFESCICIIEDDGNAFVMEGNIDELEDNI